MTTTYTYPDAYLAKFCTQAIETRAVADVAVMGTFNAFWTERPHGAARIHHRLP